MEPSFKTRYDARYEVRTAAKLLVHEPVAGSYVLVRGERPLDQGGRINLIGGGIKLGETPFAALEREVAEESPFRLSDFREISYVDSLRQEVENRHGRRFIAAWELFCAELPIDQWPHVSDLKPNKQQIFTLSADEIFRDPRVGALAKEATRTVIDFQQSSPQPLLAHEHQLAMEILAPFSKPIA